MIRSHEPLIQMFAPIIIQRPATHLREACAAGKSGALRIPKMNRRYALIALDRRHECADFPGCYLVLLTLTAQWGRGSRGNKVIADPNTLHFARLSSR